MTRKISIATPPSEISEESDLDARLANYRARVEREGRNLALERLDRAISKVTRKP